MEAEPESRPRFIRSPSYPGIGLDVAIARAETLYQRENTHEASVGTVLRHWRYSPKSGPGFTALAAVKQYGLIEDHGRGDARRIKLSPLGLQIVQDRRPGSSERLRAVQEAAVMPPVFEMLDTEFGATGSDENLAYHLEREGFTPSAAQDVVKTYRETRAFAHLDGFAPIGADAEDHSEVDQEDQSGHTDERDRDKSRRRGSGVLSYAVPVALGEDVTIEGKFPLTEAEWAQFIAVLTAMKPALVGERPPADEPEAE